VSTQYPNAIDQFPVHQDNVNEKITAAHINNIQDAIVALENALGTNLSKILGANNQSVTLYQALPQRIDTRSETITYDANGNVTQIVEKDGSTTVKTTTFTYDANGNITQMQVVAGGKTYRETYSYDGNGNITGISRTVS
jgi:YD repeat-containing protein